MNKIKNLPQRIKEGIAQYRRVITIARKPSKEDLIKISKICAMGILLIGGVGFLVYIFAILLLR